MSLHPPSLPMPHRTTPPTILWRGSRRLVQFALVCVVSTSALAHASDHDAVPAPHAALASTNSDSSTAHAPIRGGTPEDDARWSGQIQVMRAYSAAERGALGEATLYLERARYLRPFDRDIRKGLDLLRHQVQRQRMMKFPQARLTQGEPDGLSSWRVFHAFPTRVWAWSSVGFIWLSFLLWLVVRRLPASVTRDLIAAPAGLAALLALASLSCWAGAVNTSERLEPGVVTQRSPRFYRAPDALAQAEESPDLYEGGVVLIRGRDAEWLELELAGKKRVWVSAQTVVPIAIAQPKPTQP